MINLVLILAASGVCGAVLATWSFRAVMPPASLASVLAVLLVAVVAPRYTMLALTSFDVFWVAYYFALVHKATVSEKRPWIQ